LSNSNGHQKGISLLPAFMPVFNPIMSNF